MKNAIIGSTAHGPVAKRLQAGGFKVNALRTNAVLRKDEWNHYDAAILRAARQRLIGVRDLLSRNLVYRIGSLGKTVLEYEKVGELTPAEVSMDGRSRRGGTKDRPEFEPAYLPLPITFKDYEINGRVLEASRTTGEPLDTTTAELSGRSVAEELERILFHGLDAFSFGGGEIYGYTDYPFRNTVDLTDGWDSSGYTGGQVLADVLRLKQALLASRMYGPYVLYVPGAYETILDDDFKANSDKSLRARILEIGGIESIQVVDFLDAPNVLLVQMSSDTVRWVEGVPITNLEWDSEGGLTHHFKVMTVGVPQIRSDKNGNCGIAHGTPGQ